MENEVITIAPDIDTSPPAMLAIAIAQGASVADLSGLMDLQERWEANEAKKAFVVAMAKFGKKEIQLDRNAKVFYKGKEGKADTDFNFTSLDHMTKILRPELSKCGLSFNWKTEQDMQSGGKITVTCTLTHIMGHSESTSLTSGPDQSGGKNNIQAVGSTTTYLQRYTLRAITGTAEAGQDDDGNAAGKPTETISEEQCLTLEALISDNDLPSGVFHDWLLVAKGATHIDQIPANEYRSVVRKINSSIEARRENK